MSFQTQAAVLVPERPALRGISHLIGALAATAGAVWLLLIADSPTGYVSGAVFGTSLILLYSASTAYHRFAWKTFLERTFKRVDHAMIFVLIAGTYTPFCLNVSLAWGIPILAVVWSLAGAGTLIKLVWLDSPRWVGVSLYIGLGWVGLVSVSEVFGWYAASPLTLLAIGGALYMLGGIVYATRRPDPFPRIFGFHEVFHALVVGGSVLHYVAIAFFVL